MIDINIDLEENYIGLVYKEIMELKNKGFKFLEYDEWKTESGNKDENEYKRDLIFQYYNVQHKFVSSTPRNIKKCSDFKCPDKYTKGLELLEGSIISGEDLFPRYSRQIFKFDSNDGMLLDFGIYHLHLGTKPDAKHKGLIEGTEDVLYCMFDDKSAYFIKIAKHGLWNNVDLLKAVKDSFPEVLNKFKVEGIIGQGIDVTEDLRKKIRSKHMNCGIIEIDNEYYMQPGLGMNSKGTSNLSVQRCLRQLECLRIYEEDIVNWMKDNEQLIQGGINENKVLIEMTKYDNKKIYLEDKNGSMTIEFDYTNGEIQVDW